MKLTSIPSTSLFAAMAVLSISAQAASDMDKAAEVKAPTENVKTVTSVPPVGDISASIANATTSADNQRIADYFSRKAASYDAEAAMHKKMALSYGSRPKGDSAAMTAHCQALETQFSNAAKEARALEQAHRQLASSTGK